MEKRILYVVAFGVALIIGMQAYTTFTIQRTAAKLETVFKALGVSTSKKSGAKPTVDPMSDWGEMEKTTRVPKSVF